MPSPGARVPSIPPGSRRMVICVPDNVEWLSLVTGCLAQLTFGWYYNKNSGDWEAARDRAKQMYFEFQDQNGLCDMIDCDEVADCIESSENVQQAIRNWLDANYQFSNSDYPPNIPLPAAERSADRAGVFNPGCDLDILWAQSLQLVEWMNERVSQALDVIEATTNTFEFAGAVSQITGLDEISVDAAFAYGGLLQEFIGENYAAGYSDIYRDTLACEIFCAAQNDCEISLDDLFNLFKTRVENYFGTSGTFGVLDDVIDYLTGSAIDGTIVVDAAFFLLWGGVSLANWIVGGLTNNMEIGTKSLNLLLKLAVNDANNDWQLLCGECACPTVTVPATGDWQVAAARPGLRVAVGVEYELTATGTTGGYGGTPPYNANGIPTTSSFAFPVVPAHAGGLYGFIDADVGADGSWFFIGTSLTFTVDRTGTLRLAIADAAGNYGNNTGSLEVERCQTV